MATIRKFLDLSSNHLTREDQEFLHTVFSRETGNPIIPRAETATGWFMYADEAAEIQLADVPHSICIIMSHAREQGCDYVLFDENGPEDPDLPIYNSQMFEPPG
jgi:hypothetical protein